MSESPTMSIYVTPRSRQAHWLLLIAPVVIMSVALLLFDRSANLTMGEFTGLVHTVANLSQPTTFSDLLIKVRARFIWLTSVLLNTVVPVGAAWLCGLFVYRAHGRGRLWLWGSLVVRGVLCLGGFAALLQSIATQEVLYRSVFAFTCVALEESKRFTPAFLSYVHSLVSLTNGLAVTVPVIAVLAASSTVAPPPR